MTEIHITRCPHCQTTFRIRLEQLAAAKGAVRCGSCLQVFKAANHLISGASKASPAQTVDKPKKKEIKPDEGLFDDIPDQINDDPLEDFGIRQPDRDHDEVFTSSLQLDDSVFSIEPEKKTSRYSLYDDKHDSDNHSDDSWATDLIDDHNDNSSSSSSNHSDNYDESWADALLDVDEDLVDEIDRNTDPHAPQQEDDFVPSLDGEPESNQYHLSGDSDLEQDMVEIELTLADSVNDLLDEPLNLDNKSKKKTPEAKGSDFLWLWLSGAIIMLFALVVQIGYFKFDSWSRHPQYRPVYAFSCQLLNCQLPAIQNINKMATQHFMVRPHPKVKQALYIDTLLINNANYEQPFPDVNLIFTGLNEETVASRHFKPEEYLAGELAGSNSMPLNVPIHIAIEIASPGAEAVGYRIELVANH